MAPLIAPIRLWRCCCSGHCLLTLRADALIRRFAGADFAFRAAGWVLLETVASLTPGFAALIAADVRLAASAMALRSAALILRFFLIGFAADRLPRWSREGGCGARIPAQGIDFGDERIYGLLGFPHHRLSWRLTARPRSDMLPDMRKILLLLAMFCAAAYAQLTPELTWAVQSQNRYRVIANVTYGIQNNYETKLDIYERRDTAGPQPTVMFIHGGGWVGGSKETSLMSLIPWMQMGWNVVNVEYRLGRVSLAPAAVEDCLCALRWVAALAKDYNFDVAHLVVTGESAGGHLALTTGMIPQAAGLDRQCPGVDLPKVSAIVNWYGITDVNDVLDGPNQKTYAVAWFGSMADKAEIARRVSPLTYVRRDLPPVLTIHGDADPTVPYSEATRLRDALTNANVPNELLTIPGGHHGNFTPEERVKIFATIREFLTKYHVM